MKKKKNVRSFLNNLLENEQKEGFNYANELMVNFPYANSDSKQLYSENYDGGRGYGGRDYGGRDYDGRGYGGEIMADKITVDVITGEETTADGITTDVVTGEEIMADGITVEEITSSCNAMLKQAGLRFQRTIND